MMDRNQYGEGSSRTILIVDDDVDEARSALNTIGELLPRLRTRAVHSAEDFFFYLQGEHGFSDRAEFPYPNLVLLDLKMAGLDGFDALLWLRRHPPHNELPVVVLTEEGELQLAKSARVLGARSYLTKPLRVDSSWHRVQRLREWLDFDDSRAPVGLR
jgi:CheY-like chemotaxis protein